MVDFFQLLAQATAAFNQAGLLAGAGFSGGIGALLLGNRAYWRLAGTRVEGTIIGVRESSRGIYFPVYRYRSPDGITMDATSDTGTSATSGLETGRSRPLLVLRRQPAKATDAGSYLTEIIGGVLLGVAVAMGTIALTAWPITRLTWVMLGAVVVYCATHLHRSVPRANPDASQSPLLRGQPRDLHEAPVRPIESILSRRRAEAQQARQRLGRIVTPILVMLGLGVLALGVHIGRRVSHLEASGARTPGTVVGLDIESTLRNRNYYPVVRFRTPDGIAVEFRDGTGSNPPAYREGDTVTVLFLSASPEDTAIIDRGRWNWLGPAALCSFGTMLTLIALRARLGSPK